MNGLLRKEVRSILPAWLLALVLAVLPVWLVWPGPQGVMLNELGLLVFAPFGFGVLVLSLTPFGQELNWGTFSVLLSQPVARRHIWSAKVWVLAAALATAFLAFCLSTHFRVESALDSMKHTVWRNAFDRPGDQSQFFVKLIADTRRTASQESLLIGGLEVLAGFAGGLWTTLLFRQVTAAFWLTLLVPMGLTVVVSGLLKNLPDTAGQTGLALVLGAYSAWGFVWAQRFFLRVQDTQWTGGVVALPSEFMRGSSIRAVHKLKPIRALLRKEFQAQQVNVLLAGGLLLVHLGVIAIRRLGSEYLSTHRSIAMTLEMVPLLWLAMPLLIGSVSIAEERKLGIFQTSLCLPAGRRKQFFTKLLVAMALGILFGAILPLLVEGLAAPGSPSEGQRGLVVLEQITNMVALQVAGATGLTLLGFYASSLTRNGLQAMGVGLLATVLTCLVILGAQAAGNFRDFVLWRGPLIGFIGLPLMLFTVVGLAYRNHNKLQPGIHLWIRNCTTLFLALLCAAAVTTTIYHRAWEAWLPEEPPHRFGFVFAGAGAMNQMSPRVGNPFRLARKGAKLEAAGQQKAVLLGDGRLWLHQRPVQLVQVTNAHQGIVTWWRSTGPWRTGFIDGTNWKDVALMPGGCFAIRTDGTLWNLTEIELGKTGPKRVGESQQWMSISAGFGHFCALKSDGTLWQWGWRRNASIKALGAAQPDSPKQVGTDDDWVAVCDSPSFSAAVKADGSIWRWDWNSKTRALPERWLDGACGEPVLISANYKIVATVCADGTLWLGGDLTNSVYTRLVGVGLAQRATREMVRWGNDSDWKTVRFVSWGKAVGIKRDGSLWEWNVNHSFGPMTGWVTPPTVQSRYDDWVSVCDDNNAFLALAQDGSLCLWGDPEDGGYDYDWYGIPNPRRLTMPSRIKATKIADLAR